MIWVLVGLSALIALPLIRQYLRREMNDTARGKVALCLNRLTDTRTGQMPAILQETLIRD